MVSNFYNLTELLELGFKSIGKNVLISKKCSIYGAQNMIIGDNVRIDDFCILSGEIVIGDYVHISAYVALYGKYKIIIGNFVTISARTTIYSATDDFSGEFMISPMVPVEFTNIIHGAVVLKDYVQIGANNIIMSNLTLDEGVATGAFSFVNKSLEEWAIYFGIPAKFYKLRSKKLQDLACDFLKKEGLK